MPPKRASQEGSGPVVRSNDHKNNISNDDNDDDGGIAPFNKFLNTHYSAEFMATLPTRIHERAQVLLKYDEQVEKMEKELLVKQIQLRKKYEEVFAPIFKRRFEIITGTSQPASEEEIRKGYPDQHVDKVKIETTKKSDNDKDKKF